MQVYQYFDLVDDSINYLFDPSCSVSSDQSEHTLLQESKKDTQSIRQDARPSCECCKGQNLLGPDIDQGLRRESTCESQASCCVWKSAVDSIPGFFTQSL